MRGREVVSGGKGARGGVRRQSSDGDVAQRCTTTNVATSERRGAGVRTCRGELGTSGPQHKART